MSSIAVQAVGSAMDIDNIKNGIVSISYKSPTNATTAVRIEKSGEKKDHILEDKANFPLQFGEGEYTITLLEGAGGNKFRIIESQKIKFQSENKNNIYLQTMEMINWNKDMNSIKKAKEITKNSKTDKEKITKIYDYIVENIVYDNNKAKTVQPGYLSSIDLTLKEGQGICYDYSALLAGMARSLNIPTKLVEGRKNDIKEYHAWNQVYLKETDEWIVIDTTYDAGLKKGNATTEMIKDSKEYKVEKQY